MSLRRAAACVAVLVVAPAMWLGIPALVGHVPISGDAEIQTFPLRVLAGELIRSGHLPTWDPYIWAGTPLLAGFNAGALFPASLLFAVLSPGVAWVLTAIAAYAVAGIGAYVFLLDHDVAPAAALLGAASFAFAGVMNAQYGHMDVIEGIGLAPWLLWLIRRVSRPGAYREVWGWTVLLAVGLAFLSFTGEPETILYVGALVALYVVATAVRHHGRSPVVVGRCLIGLVSGVLLGAPQWLPGLDWQALSQRASTTYAFFTSFSLPPKDTILSAVPYLLGGFGQFGQPYYSGPADLAELGGYVGVVPLVAVACLATRRWRPSGRGADLTTWVVIGLVALVLAWGGYTPVGHLLRRLPLWGGQRGSSRNLLSVDLALAVLMALWLDGVLRARRPKPGARRGKAIPALVPFVPALGAAALRVAFALRARAVLVHLGVAGSTAASLPTTALHRLGYEIDVTLVLMAAAGLATVLSARTPRVGLRLGALGGVVVVDLVVFVAQGYVLWSTPEAVLSGRTPLVRLLRRDLVGGSRVGFFAPDLLDQARLESQVVPDLNLISGLRSVNGYGSIVGARYEAATGAHDMLYLDPASLVGNTFDRLGLGVLVTPPGSFSRPLDGRLPQGPPEPMGAGARRSWFLGDPAQVLSVRLRPATGTSAAPVRVGALEPSGSVEWLRGTSAAVARGATGTAPSGAVPVAATSTWRARRPLQAVGIVVEDLGSVGTSMLPPVVVESVGSVVLDGALGLEVSPGRWRQLRGLAGIALFRNQRVRPHLWLSGAPNPGTVRQVSSRPDGVEVDSLDLTSPALVTRSVVDTPGWGATLVPLPGGTGAAWTGAAGARGRGARVPVTPSKLLQAVHVPAGRWLLTWRYSAPGLGESLGLALVGLLVLACAPLLARGSWGRGAGPPGELGGKGAAQPGLESAGEAAGSTAGRRRPEELEE
ncbi:MAG: hypothetical protein ACRDYD_01585 [Acidimicrobiales bacterium]